ncbi:MAG: glycine cleavage system protein T [Candidatus Schekmanbacteria bacterium RIFCSPHIGHO2_02_FULL_38_11]|uniref:Aminomethyltransferase n=1 Tax=Candidatus Schekmanbacteria bacterium RIFCSPLOWO2_12_FULL_38_15 TaxID=1817883 RepID=A0A1F7SH69_9BACT|nr:MAG: glycine cleavage system protein T [Candidatus Schekmanbacteria bacterium GWA2_38_9]OGL52517.1 MAG: glycine cleavage system protein T [Candidatus Schekmanbacteria bacterium RIFCSPLOWO2_12_FULL_38_15]OGL55545.1 MAG: glycine cleavage system protein T [Candidatus Schekmanbacteria bacterium RIFCSPHIGHO2_02_FULL_38_11]
MQPINQLKRTPIYNIHLRLGAKMVDFSGWEMPIQYEGIKSEHFCVRNSAGLFDVSHMGRIDFKGADALANVQYLTTNNASNMKDGKVIYSLMCNENGGIIDDVTVYRINSSHYFFCVNASNTGKDYEWIRKNIRGNAGLVNLNGEVSIIALQGPKAQKILQNLVNVNLEEIKPFWFRAGLMDSAEILISRTGYTGEDGFELYIRREHSADIWERISEKGKEYGLKPAGLGARDTLRTEMKYTLYGNEIDENVSPLEACLERYVDFNKGDFIGRDSLLKEKENGIKRRLVGFEMTEHSIPRHGFDIYRNGKLIGKVTSGMLSWHLNRGIGIGLVLSEYSETGSKFEVKIREKFYKARVIETPFYKRSL